MTGKRLSEVCRFMGFRSPKCRRRQSLFAVAARAEESDLDGKRSPICPSMNHFFSPRRCATNQPLNDSKIGFE